MPSIIGTIYFTAPAWIANTAAAIFCYFFLKKNDTLYGWPVDGGLKWNGKRILGNNKTMVGSSIMILSGWAVGYLQGNGDLGIIMGLSVLGGSLINSFFKRRWNIPEGGNLPVFDQVDYAITTSLVLYVLGSAPAAFSWLIFIVFVFVYQLTVNLLAFILGFTDGFLYVKRASAGPTP